MRLACMLQIGIVSTVVFRLTTTRDAGADDQLSRLAMAVKKLCEKPTPMRKAVQSQFVTLIERQVDASTPSKLMTSPGQLPDRKSERSASRHLSCLEVSQNKKKPRHAVSSQGVPVASTDALSSADLCLAKTPKRAREDSMKRPHALGDRLARLTAHWPAGTANSAVHADDRPQSAHTPALHGDRDL
jgi:hypothetical protein